MRGAVLNFNFSIISSSSKEQTVVNIDDTNNLWVNEQTLVRVTVFEVLV